MQIIGTVTHVEIEGGFWGILGDDGIPYQPADALTEDFQKEGLRVKASTQPSSKMSVYMWGRMVEITSIELL